MVIVVVVVDVDVVVVVEVDVFDILVDVVLCCFSEECLCVIHTKSRLFKSFEFLATAFTKIRNNSSAAAKRMGHPRPLFVYFRPVQTNIAIFTTNICEECPASIWCCDSNPRPSEHETPPITTKPGLPPIFTI